MIHLLGVSSGPGPGFTDLPKNNNNRNFSVESELGTNEELPFFKNFRKKNRPRVKKIRNIFDAEQKMESKKFRFDSFASEFGCNDNDDDKCNGVDDNDSGIGELLLYEHCQQLICLIS